MRRGVVIAYGFAWLTLLLSVSPLRTNRPASVRAHPAPVRPAVMDQMARSGTATYWVILREQADLSGAFRIADWAKRGQYVYDVLTAARGRSQTGMLTHLERRALPHRSFWILNAIQVASGPDDLEQIRWRSEVREIQADAVLTIPEPEPAAQRAQIGAVEWNVARINAPQVWSTFGVRGEGMVVASIDTGVQFDHPALVAQYRGNRGAAGFDHSYNWFDPSGVCANPLDAPCDNRGHGTHTMGIMVGDDGANRIGVAPRAQWITAKGCETFACSLAALTASAQWILAPTDLSGSNPRPDLRPHVVNNSWGAAQGDPFYQDFVRAWVAAGIFPAFANGNLGPDCGTSRSPGDYPESYASGAFDVDAQYGNNVIASFSGRGPSLFGGVKPNIAAPGVSVRSSVPTNAYDSMSGTSMASPHTAATVALMWSSCPALSGQVAQTRGLLDQTAIDMSDPQCGGTAAINNVWGEGALDAYGAVQQSPCGPAGALRGTVSDAVTGLPLSGAVVDAAGPITRATGTDDAGAYSFPVLSAGAYDVTAGAFGYGRQSASVSVVEDSTTVHDLALAPAPRYSLDGQVRDGSGSPIANASVTVLHTPLTPAITDALGHYTIAGVPPGTYDVWIQQRCFTSQTRQLVLNGDVTGFDFAPTERADAFGYTCRRVTPAYIEAGNPLGLDFDTTRKWVALPFPFTYYGRTYEAALVCAYGTLSLGQYNSFFDHCDPQLCDEPVSLPSALSPNGTIYPFWENLSVPRDSVRTELVGSAPDQRFVIEWRGVGVNGIANPIDFEIVLHENGLIETQYRNVDQDAEERGGCATIGIEDPNGTIALTYSKHQQAILVPQDAVVYRPPPFVPPPSTPAGSIADSLSVVNGTNGEITLSWGASCARGDNDYEIYEGTLGDFYSHMPRFCSTAGATTRSFIPPPWNSYYLVVPANGQREGSYGRRSSGEERPRGSGGCLPQEVASPCPRLREPW